jgi:hypothetical protein
LFILSNQELLDNCVSQIGHYRSFYSRFSLNAHFFVDIQ